MNQSFEKYFRISINFSMQKNINRKFPQKKLLMTIEKFKKNK